MAAFLIPGCLAAAQVSAQEPAQAFTVAKAGGKGWRFVGADDPGFAYIGRIDARDPKSPVLIWEGTEVRARFSGTRLGLRFSNASGQNFFNVIVDGRIRILKLRTWGPYDYVLNEELSEGMHDLVLFKRTEAMFSTAAFQGLLLAKGARLGPRPEPLPLRLEFYGDSITAGACNEDPGEDQYNDYSTHNNYLSYAAITARNLHAEYVCIAVSGTGVCRSWNPVLMPEIYDRLYAFKSSERYDFSGRRPDVVVINLGQNDFSQPDSRGEPFPADFSAKYTALVRNIRGLYPQARIVCAIGGMTAYRDSPDLREAFDRAVAELRAGDAGIYKYVFQACSENHPRVETHIRMAEELTVFLREFVVPANAGVDTPSGRI